MEIFFSGEAFLICIAVTAGIVFTTGVIVGCETYRNKTKKPVLSYIVLTMLTILLWVATFSELSYAISSLIQYNHNAFEIAIVIIMVLIWALLGVCMLIPLIRIKKDISLYSVVTMASVCSAVIVFLSALADLWHWYVAWWNHLISAITIISSLCILLFFLLDKWKIGEKLQRKFLIAIGIITFIALANVVPYYIFYLIAFS